MRGSELAQNLAKIRDAAGVIESGMLAMKDAARRDLSEDYFSDEFLDNLTDAVEAIREATDESMEAVDELNSDARVTLPSTD